jgi:hypothetical protein
MNERRIPYKKSLCPDIWEKETFNENFIPGTIVKISFILTFVPVTRSGQNKGHF